MDLLFLIAVRVNYNQFYTKLLVTMIVVGAVGNVYSRHQYARSDQEAAVFCAKAGCDWNCGTQYTYMHTRHQEYVSHIQ